MTQRCPHDGGYCHHRCVMKCDRMEMDAHLTTPHEGYPVPGNAPVKPVVSQPSLAAPCCENEQRNTGGGCDTCDGPCL